MTEEQYDFENFTYALLERLERDGVHINWDNIVHGVSHNTLNCAIFVKNVCIVM